MNIKKHDLVVVGGGPAGLIAAGFAASEGLKVLLLEQNQKTGRKLSITGKGRCNLTNLCTIPEFLKELSHNKNQAKPALLLFPPEKLVEFINQIGVETTLERGKRVFPSSGSAPEVSMKLEKWCKNQGVTITTDNKATEIIVEKEQLIGVKTSKNQLIETNFLLLATGGKSYPRTGSDGNGYHLVARLGHTIVPLRQALVPLETKEQIPKILTEINLKNVNASLWINDKKEKEEFGEFNFTQTGLGGPIIITISLAANDALLQGKKVEIVLDLKPALDETTLDARLLRELNENKNLPVSQTIRQLLPGPMVGFCLESLDIDDVKKGGDITSQERKKIKLWLKNCKFTVVGTHPWDEAIVTAGGIDLQEINCKTMESKIVKGLFFAGEILDFDANTGGFNLQIAFSTGRLAAWEMGKKFNTPEK